MPHQTNKDILTEIQDNHDLILKNPEWIKKKVTQSGEIYKSFLQTIDQHPESFPIKTYKKTIEYSNMVGSILLEVITRNTTKVRTFLSLAQSEDRDKALCLIGNKTETEVAAMNDWDKVVLMTASLDDIGILSEDLNELGKLVSYIETTGEFEEKLYSEEYVDRLLLSQLPLQDKRVFLQIKIDQIKEDIKDIGYLAENQSRLRKARHYILEEEMKTGEGSNVFEDLEESSNEQQRISTARDKEIDHKLTLLHLLISKRKRLENQSA